MTVASAAPLARRTSSRSTAWRTSVRRGPIVELSAEAGAGRRRSSPAARAARLSVPAIRAGGRAWLAGHARGPTGHAQGVLGAPRDGPRRQLRPSRGRVAPPTAPVARPPRAARRRTAAAPPRPPSGRPRARDGSWRPARSARRRSAGPGGSPRAGGACRGARTARCRRELEALVVERESERAERQHVVADVEVGVLDPERLAHAGRRPRQAAAEARHALEPRGDVAAQPRQGRAWLALREPEGGAPSHVHVRARALDAQERPVDR